MSAGLAWAVDALIASALLIAAVLLVRGHVRRAFGPNVAYALWALPLLRLVLPPLPADWTAAATPIRRVGEQVTVLVVDLPATAAASAPASPSLGMAVLAVWATGAAVFLLWQIGAYARLRRRLLAARVPVGEVEGVRVIESAAAAGPLAFGVLHRYVAFPPDFGERYDPRERDLALAHELGHHQRGDLLANWAALAVLALHWWNPLAWHAFRAFRADQELANDARVLAGRDPAERHAYACAIIKAAHGGSIGAACHLHTVSDLKGRLRMLSTLRISRARLAGGASAVAALTVVGLGLTASGQAAEQVRATVAEAAPAAAAAIAAPAQAAAPARAAEPRKTRQVVIVKDGKTTRYEGAEADAFIAANPAIVPPVPPAPPIPPLPSASVVPPPPPVPPLPSTLTGTWVVDGKPARIRAYRFDGHMASIPDVRSARCGLGHGREQTVERSRRDGRERIVICTDRIEARAEAAGEAAASAHDMGELAMVSALSSLRAARRSLEITRGLSDAQRREALNGIDQAMRGLRAEHDAD